MSRKQSGSKPEELFDYKQLNFLTKNSCEENHTFADSKYTDKVIDSSDDSYSDDDDEEETSTCLSSNKYSDEKHLLNARTEQSSFSPNAMKEKQNEYQAGRACKFMSSIQDDYFLYGQNIANRLYNSKQSNQAIANAKYEINHILNRLERGDFEPVQKRSVASLPK
ncbi:hypothetical protein CEXT_207141 [Caerostris extrusa]|uniref:Uncharacterized protein n=1 Tax=Caerostris extrusa TaxID=172846 RepID=A0AAV4RG41_CAEEX|nr:hypothetical protein CEXT_207141 [Caerostris extrusa]